MCESLVMDLCVEDRLAIKFCFKAGEKIATGTLQMVNAAYGGPSTMSFECFPMVWTIS